MRTLIVPCAGSKTIGGLPIFLNRHPGGELLAFKCIKGIYPETYDRIIYVITEELEEKYNAGIVLKNENRWGFHIETCVLDKNTTGPAMTVYYAIKKANVVGEFAVRDSDAYLKLENNYQGNFIAGLDLTKYKKTIDNLRNKSFIILNEQNNVLDVVEKHFCSDIISVGLYGFKKPEDYLMAYEHLNDSDYPFGTIYVSHIISYLIGYSQKIFHSVEVSEYEDWSTEPSWSKIQKSYANCFLDLDELFKDKKILPNETLNNLRRLSNSKVAIIPYTYKTDAEEKVSYLKVNEIKIVDTICGCNFSQSDIIIKNSDDIRNLLLEI